MAEKDERLEIIEDEVKVLKGEVKRTLVDLRALLMREDSPLAEGALARRSGMSGQAPESQPGQRAAQGSPGPREVPEMSRTAVAAEPIAAEGTDAVSVTLMGSGSADLPGAPPAGFLPAKDASFPSASGPRIAPDSTSDEDEEEMDQLQPADELETEAEPDTDEAADPQHAARNGHRGHSLSDATGPEPDEATPNGHHNRIYEEYQDLLNDPPETDPLEDEAVGPPVDINLLASLVHWTYMARQRVGEQQLKGIIELYIQSGHSSPALQDLLLSISSMVEGVPSLSREGPQEWMDLMFYLHGILTGGLPVVKIPQIRLPGRGGLEDQVN